MLYAGTSLSMLFALFLQIECSHFTSDPALPGYCMEIVYVACQCQCIKHITIDLK